MLLVGWTRMKSIVKEFNSTFLLSRRRADRLPGDQRGIKCVEEIEKYVRV